MATAASGILEDVDLEAMWGDEDLGVCCWGHPHGPRRTDTDDPCQKPASHVVVLKCRCGTSQFELCTEHMADLDSFETAVHAECMSVVTRIVR